MTKNGLFTIGALGDSITTAFNAERSGDDVAASWATGGERVLGHAHRLAAALPALTVRSVNAARAGAQAQDLELQVDRLLPSAPDYVTLLVGANDLTRWLLGGFGPAVDRYERDVRTAVLRLKEANPRVLILLGSLPDQSRVLDLVIARGLGGAAGGGWGDLVPPSLRAGLQQAYTERWTAANRALEDVAAAYPGQVRLARGIARARFAGEHLSPLDSYHPSVEGQRLLARVTWDEGFFP
jgi:lysophospholipase L1-like esterase